MDEISKLTALLDLAEEMGIMVRRAPLDDSAGHPGGALVRVGEREMLFVDPTAPTGDQIGVVASALGGRAELDDRYLPPSLRACLDAAGPLP
jgi:hypothetical protein